jgi:uncharacterized Tic20 family protein
MADESLSEADRSGAMLAHLSGYAGYVVPCGGVIVPLVIALTVQSKAVAVIARQALLLNVLGFLSLAPVLGAWFVVLAVRNGLVQGLVIAVTSLWVMVVIALVLLCPLIGAIRASGGRYFRYPIFGIALPPGA